MMHVVAAIRDGRVTQTPEGHLQLPDGVTWPGTTNGLLFVRSFYSALFADVLCGCASAAGQPVTSDFRRIVTGHPGIGKTVWA